MNSSTIFNTPVHVNVTEMNSSSISNAPALLNNTLNIPLPPILTAQECLENIKNRIKPNVELHCHSEMTKMQERFNNLMFKHKIHLSNFIIKGGMTLKVNMIKVITLNVVNTRNLVSMKTCLLVYILLKVTWIPNFILFAINY